MSNIDRAKAQLEEGLFDTDSSDDDDIQNSSSSDDDGSGDDTSLTKLKPALAKGDRVVAAWWDLSRNERMNQTTGKWFSGKVHAVKERDRYGDSRAATYGPIRVYEIHYDDGDELEGILDVFVCPEKDYDLENNTNSRDWKGVRNEKDRSSSDRYAKEIGWYVATTGGGGEEKSFSTLYEAMKKADEYIIKIKNGDVRKSDLNLPDEWKLSTKTKRGRPTTVEDDRPTKKKKVDMKDLFDNTGSDSDDDMEEEEEEKEGSKSANFTGAIYIKTSKRYKSIFHYKDKQMYVGEYVLQVDAAHARDEGFRALSISGGRNGFNFHTEEEYMEARSKEISARGLSLQDTGSLSEVAAKIQEKVKKWGETKKRNIVADEEESEDDSFASDQDEEGDSDAGSKSSGGGDKTTITTYTGVSFIRATRKYRGFVRHNERSKGTGDFLLGVDAAHSRDEFCRATNKTNNGFNFNTEEEYKDARANEIKRRGLSLAETGTLADMLVRMQAKRTNWSESMQRNDDADSSHSSSDDLPLAAMNHKPYRENVAKTSSDYHGVEYNQREGKHWKVSIFYNGKDRFVGVYDLESDAARVFDEVATILVSNNDRNFATKSDHEKARKQEAEKLGLSLESIVSFEESMEKAQIYLNSLLSGAENDGERCLRKKRATSPFIPIVSERQERSEASPIANVAGSGKKIADLNDAMSKKWGNRLAESGSRFLESYQNSIEEMLGGVAGQSKNNTPIGTFVSISTVRSADGQEEHDVDLDSADNKMWCGEQQSPKYTGITKLKSGKFYRSQIGHKGLKPLGNYIVAADAAHAYDKYVRALNLSNRTVNFSTQQAYEEARAKEIEERGLNFISTGLAEVTAKINAKIAKWEASVQGDKSTDDSPRSIDVTSSSDFEGTLANDQMENDVDVGSVEKMKTVEQLEDLAGAGHDDQETEVFDLSNDDEKKEAKYAGVTKLKGSNRYRGQIWYSGKTHAVGDYLLGADAAHARDIFCRSFNINKTLNFITVDEYERARKKEIEQRGLTSDSSLTIVATRIEGKKKKWEAESKKSSPGADVVPEPKSHSNHTTQDDDSDDISLFSDTRDEQENFAMSQQSAAATVAASNVTAAMVTPKLTEMNLVQVVKEQEEILEFPPGCRVLWKLRDESFHRGVVSSAWLDMNPPINIVYEVEPLDGKSKQMKCVASVLAFDTHCPVYIKSSPTDNNSLVEGEVLFSRTVDTKTFYTILLKREGNEFQLKEDVSSDLVRFRKVTKEKPSPSRRLANVSESNKKDSHSEQKSQTKTNSAKEVKPKLNSCEKEVGRHCDMSISTSNSTISTRDSVRMSTPRGLSGNGARWDERSIDVELPRWFVSDNRVKDHLTYHLTGSPRGRKTIFAQIYDKTNCTLKMPHDANIIRIETVPGKFAIESLRKAKIELENIFLDYLDRDGSIGRLFFDLAFSCQHLHPQRGSSCVYQRNPWQPNEMGYMSVIELPYIGNDCNKAHTFHLLGKKIGTLRKVGSVGCTIKIVDRRGRVITNWVACKPYVWVWGHKPGDVDKAVQILNDANREHVNNCKCDLPK